MEQLRYRHTSPVDDEPAETIPPFSADASKTEPDAQHTVSSVPPQPRQYNPRWPTGGIGDRDSP